MATKKTSKLGFDPLSWMQDDDFDALQESVADDAAQDQKETLLEPDKTAVDSKPKRRVTRRKKTATTRRRTKVDANQEGKGEMVSKNDNLMTHVGITSNILEHSPVNIMIADINEDIVFVNKMARDTLTNLESELDKYLPGFKATEVVGGSIHRYHKDPAAIKALLAGLGPDSTRKGFITPGPFLFQHETRPLYNEQGDKMGYVVQWHDVTQQRIEEEQARRLQREIGRASCRERVCLYV